MAYPSEGLISSIKSAVKGGISSTNVSATKDEVTPIIKIIGKNFMTLPGIARDLNVARQNAQKLVKIEGGTPAKGADAFFLKQSEREKKLEVDMDKDKPTPVKKESPIKSLMDRFAPKKITETVKRIFNIVAIGVFLFETFKESFTEWTNGLYESIKEKFTEFVGDIKTWFNDTIGTIVEKTKTFINDNIIQPVSNLFKSVGDWFVDKFNSITSLVEPAMAFVKGVIDKVMSVVNAIKEKVGAVVDGAKKIASDAKEMASGAVSRVKRFFTGEKEEVKPPVEEKKPAEVPKEEKVSAPTEKPPPVEVAPPPQPILVPGPPPVVEGKPTRIPKAQELQKPITVEPPTPTGKAAEGPEKQAGGSFSSVVTTQSGVDLSGLHPEFEKRLTAMATAFKEQTGKKILVTSGSRSNEKQAELFNAKLNELGGDRAATRKKVAEPMPPLGKGRGSFHLKGLAIDVNSKGAGGINSLAGDRESPTGWLEAFGLTRPVAKENWHIQPMGTLPTADNPENPGSPVLVAGKDSKPMNLAEGKKESIGQPEPKSTAASGSSVASASVDLAGGQRAQQKPQTPIIVNAPVTNTTMVTQKKVAVVPPKSCQDSVKMLTARLT
jgi:hypothetical protein